MTPARRLRRAAPFLAGAAVSLTALVGCGIGVDEGPRALEVEATTTTVTVPATGGFASAVLYYLSEGALVPIAEELPDNAPTTVLETLLQVPSEDQAANNLATSIPAGTELLSLRLVDTHATVDLSDAFDNVQGLSRQQAVGQMVMTVTQLPGVDTVSFRVDGEEIAVASATRGDVDEVDACDFARLLSDTDAAVDAGLPVSSAIELGQRRDALEASCPAGTTIGG